MILGEGKPIYEPVHVDLKDWTLENTLDMSRLPPIAYHDGCVKYFKEIGVWTPEHEAWQEKQLADQQARVDAWEAKYNLPKGSWEAMYRHV